MNRNRGTRRTEVNETDGKTEGTSSRAGRRASTRRDKDGKTTQRFHIVSIIGPNCFLH